MDKTCKRRQRPDIGKHNGRASGCAVQLSPNKTAYTMTNRRSGRLRNDKTATLGMVSAFHLCGGRDKTNPAKNGEQKKLWLDKMALLRSQRRSDGAIQSLSKSLTMTNYRMGESPKMFQSLEADTKHFLKSYHREKPKMDFVTFHKTVDANIKKMVAAGCHDKNAAIFTTKTRNNGKISERIDFGTKLSNFAQSGDKKVLGFENELSTKKARLPTPMPNSLEPQLVDKLSDFLHTKHNVVPNARTNFTVNPVVVEMQNKSYKRTEHKIVLKDFGKRDHMNNDISWFKRLLPEEYFIKPNIRKTILPYKDSPYERANRQAVIETVTVKPSKLIEEKPKEKKTPIKVSEDRLGVGGVNIDDLRPARPAEEVKKEEERPRPDSPKHIELKPMKLPRLPFERIKKQGKGFYSMIESSDDSIRTKEVSSRPNSSRRYTYERTAFASRKSILEELKRDRIKRDEECKKNFSKFMSITHSSKTQDELLKSQDPKSLGRREGLNVLFQRHAEKAVDESLLHKWQRLGRKFFPEALTEELRYRKQQNRIFNEYLNNSNNEKSSKQQRPPQANVYKKPDTSGTVLTIQLRQPTINQQPKTDMDKMLITKGLDKTLDKFEKESQNPSLPSTNKTPADTTDKSIGTGSGLEGNTLTVATNTSFASEEAVAKKEQINEKVKQHQGQMAPGKTEASHVGKDGGQNAKNGSKESSTLLKSKQKKISKRGKVKNGKRITETKLKAIGDFSKTTASSNIFEKNLSTDGTLETSLTLNTLDDLSWSMKNYIPTNTMTNAYWVQTKHNVPQSLLDYTKQAILKSSSTSKDTGNLTTEKNDTYVDEWGQYGRTASEADKLLATLTERTKMVPFSHQNGLPLEKRYPQEIEMVKPILLPSLYNRHSANSKVPLEKKYPIESELIQPVKLPQFGKTGTSKSRPWKKSDHPSDSRHIKQGPRTNESPGFDNTTGFVKRFAKGSKYKYQPTSKLPPPDIIPAVIRDQAARSKDLPRKTKAKIAIPDIEPSPKGSTKRLTLVERLRQRIDARRKAQKIAMMENEFLSGNDKLEAKSVKPPNEHLIGTTLYSFKKKKSEEAVSDESQEMKSRNVTSYDYVEQCPLSWDFLHTKKDTINHTRQAVSPRRGRTVTKLNRTISPRTCSKDRSVKTSSPEAEVFEQRRCEVSRTNVKPKSAGYNRARAFSKERPKTTSFTDVVSPRELSPKTPPQQPKTARTYYVGCSREASDTDRDYESDFEEDISQKSNKSRKSAHSRKSYNENFIPDFEKKKIKPKAKPYRDKDETNVSVGKKPKSKIPWKKRNMPRTDFPYKRKKSSEESSAKVIKPRRQVTRKKPNTVIPSDRGEIAANRNVHSANRCSQNNPKRSSSDVVKNRPEWVSSKRFEPLAPAESLAIKNIHKRKFKHVQPRYLEPKKPKPTPPETPPTPPKKNPKLKAVQSRYLETPNCLKITHSIKSLLERNADRLKGCFPKNVVARKSDGPQKKKLEPLKPICQFRPPVRNKDLQGVTTNETRDKPALPPKSVRNAKSRQTHLDAQKSCEKPPAIDFSQDVVNRKDDMRRVFPKRLYDDLYTARTGKIGNLYSRQKPTLPKPNITNRFKQFDNLLASTQKTFKKKLEFSDLSDADDKDTRHFENSFKSILKECDAINELLTPVLLPPPSAKLERAFGKYLTNDKPKSASQNTDYPNFLTWKTDFIQEKKPLNTFTAIHEIKFPKTNDNSSSFTKGQYSVDSELVTSFPSLTSTPDKSKEVLSNTDDCLTPDCYCKKINTLSSVSMTYAVCPTSTVGDPDMLSPISSLPELSKKKSESSFSTPTCFCSSAYKSSTSNCDIQLTRKENSLKELKKKIEEAIVQISLKKPKSKCPIRQSLPPLRKPSSHVKFLESVAAKMSSSEQTETPPPLMPGKRQPLSPLSRTTNSDIQSSQTKKRNLFTYPVQIPDPIMEQICQRQNTMNDQIRLPKKFTPLPSIFDRNPCNFCPELTKTLNEYLSSNTSSTSLSSISSLTLPWSCPTKKSTTPKESKNSNLTKSKQEKQVFRCSPPSSPFAKNLSKSLKPYTSYISSSQKSSIGDSNFINNPLIEYSFPPAEPIHSLLKSPLPSILKTSNTKSTRKLSDVKSRMNSPGKKLAKLKNPRGNFQLQPEHSSTGMSGVDTLNTLRSISLSGLDTDKIMYSGSRKVTSEISVRKTKVSSKRTSSGKIDERFPKEMEPVRPVLLPSVRAKMFSQSKLYVSGQQPNTDCESTTCLSSSVPTLSYITQHVQQQPPEYPREEEVKTEMSEKCCLSRTPMTSSIEITGVPNEMPKTSINRIEQFLQQTRLDAGRKEPSLIHVHKTPAVMNVHHNDRDPSAESFLDSSTGGSISLCDNLQGEQMRTNMRDGVGHRFFRKPPPVVTELIEIKSECPPVVCERSMSDILPHAATAKMNILQHRDRSASARQSSQSTTRKENLVAGDSVTVEDSVTQLAETESLAATSSTQTEKLSGTTTTSTTSTSKSVSTNETQTEVEEVASSEKPAAAPEIIVQTALVELKGEKTDVSCSQVEPSEKSALKTEQVDVSVSVQSLGSIPPLSPSDVMVGGSPRQNRSLSDVRRGTSPQNRRNAPQEGVGYSFFRGEFDPPVRKPKIDSCVQTEKYQKPKKQCTMTSVDAVD